MAQNNSPSGSSDSGEVVKISFATKEICYAPIEDVEHIFATSNTLDWSSILAGSSITYFLDNLFTNDFTLAYFLTKFENILILLFSVVLGIIVYNGRRKQKTQLTELKKNAVNIEQLNTPSTNFVNGNLQYNNVTGSYSQYIGDIKASIDE